MDKIVVTITKKDFAGAPYFDSPGHCPLSNALNRNFRHMGLWRSAITLTRCFPDSISLPTVYRVPTEWGRRMADTTYPPDRINTLIEKAKKGEDVEDVVLTLEKQIW